MTPVNVNYLYYAVVLNVVDGDTVDLMIDLGFRMQCKQRIRLLGIDAPERGKPGADESTKFLRRYLSQAIAVQTYKCDSFGRFLGILFEPLTGENINKMMLDRGLARLWDGN